MKAKRLTGEKAAEYIEDGMIIGLGTGSTAYYAVKKVGELVRDGLKIKAVPTSKETAELAAAEGIDLVELADVEGLDLTIDGADEVDPDFNLIKGGGGALLREKIVASATDKLVIVVDESKLVEHLGAFPLPVEVTPFSWQYTQRMIEKFSCSSEIRRKDGEIFVTDNGNYILDCDFGQIEDPLKISVELNKLPGVVENGIFAEMAEIIVVGYNDGHIEVLDKE
ncbi:ribose-5-phosphate isomerase RpiA [Halanaerobium congolense]|jgi:ribose 5-phosphate isomerase A|uniref:ribose-5-phosphate isomerase RpiA n=1 Tax=Halanaerobium congolense TaxID=54121 RepID=UPI000890EF33|nr:ribose-5-phosphate isomerase RpiA [Halanaerobium congolense]SDH42720.1 ribose-5-phosphate isomerase [Halanaerobium congolense]SDK99435.1 ribose-5-phosphate isomerase [Halanaerobium congolense]SDN02415.1 ribose-5-phosphate isomerase [Halanaerobium congolense]SHM87289.1 ribose-5-phosphate isomerase [Halanaerobium congolense]